MQLHIAGGMQAGAMRSAPSVEVYRRAVVAREGAVTK